MKVSKLLLLTCSVVVWTWFATMAAAAERPGVTLLTPKPGAVVGRMEEVLGETQVPGTPVVLVRSDLPGDQWWVQEPAEPTARGNFKALARFGNAVTRDGTAFRAVVVIAKTADDMKALQVGAALRDLPKGLPRSAEIRVVLNRADRATAAVASVDKSDSTAGSRDVVTKPSLNGKVNQLDEVVVKGDIEAAPVVLVRGEEEHNSPWWIQAPADKTETGYTALARFGNDRTPDGTRFEIVVLLPKASDDLSKFEAGGTVTKFPAGMARSKVVRVVLDRKSFTTSAEAGQE